MTISPSPYPSPPSTGARGPEVGLHAVDAQPRFEVRGQRARAARVRHFARHPLGTASGQQIDEGLRVTLLRQLLSFGVVMMMGTIIGLAAAPFVAFPAWEAWKWLIASAASGARTR